MVLFFFLNSIHFNHWKKVEYQVFGGSKIHYVVSIKNQLTLFLESVQVFILKAGVY